jgi:rRNA processing protein Gar1
MGFPKQKIKLLGFLDTNNLVKSSFDIFGLDTVILSGKLSKVGRVQDLLGPSNRPLYYVELKELCNINICDPLFTEGECLVFHYSDDSEASKSS